MLATLSARRALAPPRAVARRQLSLWQRVRDSMNERSERYREASESHLERTRSSLQKDIKTHESAFKELGGVIRKDRHTVRGPAAALGSPSEAFAFPTLQGHSLAGEEVSLSADGLFHRQLTLLGCCGSQHGQEMVDGWLEGLSAALVPQGPPALPVRTVWLSLVDSPGFSWVRMVLVGSMRMSVPKERHDSFVVHFGDSGEMRRRLQMENRHLGYVALVDSQARVRWHVHGSETPTDEEVAALARLIEAEAAPPEKTRRKR